MTTVVCRHQFNTSQFMRLSQVGILPEGARVELVHGEIIDMSPIGPTHSGIVNLLNRLLGPAVSKSWVLCVQNPIDLGAFDMPQPDICLASWRKDAYRNRHPGPHDIGLIIEVAETSLEFDTGAKRALYASCGIVEYWVVDIPNQRIEVSTGPGPNGYASTVVLAPGQAVCSTTVEGLSLQVAEIFPPA